VPQFIPQSKDSGVRKSLSDTVPDTGCFVNVGLGVIACKSLTDTGFFVDVGLGVTACKSLSDTDSEVELGEVSLDDDNLADARKNIPDIGFFFDVGLGVIACKSLSDTGFFDDVGLGVEPGSFLDRKESVVSLSACLNT